jgi:glycine/D-amino acid oxidase-like deaminating enzyme
MPMAGGQYRTTGFGEDENAAQGAALKAAQAACDKQSRRLEVVSTQTKYKGVVSESTNQNIAAANKIAAYAGAWVPTLSDDNDYEVTLQFTCAA